MSKERRFEQDYKTARRLERGSRLGMRHPRLIGRFFTPKYGEPRQWYASAMSADVPGLVWCNFDGVEASGRLPSNYTHAIVLGAPLPELARHADLSIGRVGAAYRLGKAALFTRDLVTPEEYLNAQQHDLYVAFGVGEGPLQAQLVVAGAEGSSQEIKTLSDIVDIAVPVPKPTDELARDFAARGKKLIWV